MSTFRESVIPTPVTSTCTQSIVDERYHALLQQVREATKHSAVCDALAIGVTSTFRGEGVSTVANNLAIAAAEVAAGPVLLVDANPYNPAIGQLHSAGSNYGLRDWLRDDLPMLDCITDSRIENLSLMPPGQSRTSEAMIFNDSSMNEMADSLRRHFRWTIFDLPPAEEYSTCLALAGRLDGVLLVVEAERVDGETGRRTCERLRRTEALLLGVVYNKARHTSEHRT